MEHRWSSEMGARNFKGDVCEICSALRVKATKGGIIYVDAHGNMSGEMPSCKQNDERKAKGEYVA